jgi:hypothetical protein
MISTLQQREDREQQRIQQQLDRQAAYVKAVAAQAKSQASAAAGAALAPLKSDRTSIETAATAASDLDDEDLVPYWEEEEWVPLTKSGKQRTPNQIRSELQKYLDMQKAEHGATQTAILERIGASPGSFRKFMNPKTYKDPWSAVQNETYWDAARFLEKQRIQPKIKAKAAPSAKRSAAPSTGEPVAKKTKTGGSGKAVFAALVHRIQAVVTGVDDEKTVYDGCPIVVKKIKSFLASSPGATKTAFCQTLGVQAVQLSKFLLAKGQDGAGQVVYARAYRFFEQKRVLDKEPKTQVRLKNEKLLSSVQGFDLHAPGLCLYYPGEEDW